MLKYIPKVFSSLKFIRPFATSDPMCDLATMEDFKSHVVQSKLPVMIAFTAEWCGTCKQMKPQLMKNLQPMEGKLKMCKVDIDKFGELAEKFDVTMIPTVVFLKEGKIKDRLVGKFTPEKFLEAIEKVN